MTTKGQAAATAAPRALAGRRTVAVVPLAALAWLLGMLPRLLSRATGTTLGSVEHSSALTSRSVLVWDYPQLAVVLVLALVGGAAAGLTTRWCARPEGRRRELVVLASAGAGTSVALAVVLAYQPEDGQPGSTSARWLLQAALVGIALLGTCAGLAVGLLVALGSPTGRVVASGALAAALAVWVELLVAAAISSDHAPVAPTGSLAALVAGGLVGAGLARTDSAGRRGVTRVTTRVGAAALMVVTPAILAGAGRVLERLHGVRTDLRPLSGQGVRATVDHLAQPGAYAPVVAALVVALAVTVARWRRAVRG